MKCTLYALLVHLLADSVQVHLLADSVSSLQGGQLHSVPRDPRGNELPRIPGRYPPSRHQRARRAQYTGGARRTPPLPVDDDETMKPRFLTSNRQSSKRNLSSLNVRAYACALAGDAAGRTGAAVSALQRHHHQTRRLHAHEVHNVSARLHVDWPRPVNSLLCLTHIRRCT